MWVVFYVLILNFRYKEIHGLRIFGKSASIRMELSSTVPKKTQEVFDRLVSKEAVVGGAGGSSSLKGLISIDNGWEKLKNGAWKHEPFQIVREMPPEEKAPTLPKSFDVAVCGGTLGIFHAIALQKRGYSTVVCERGVIAGRPQEWNISRNEMAALVRLGILTLEEIESVVGIEFNPVRIGFKIDTSTPEAEKEGFELFTKDVLNLGIRPDKLISLVKDKYVSMGGQILEHHAVQSIEVYTDAAVLHVGKDESRSDGDVRARLVLDAMGNQSPIAKQARGPREPDGICVVVGTCARGFDQGNNTYSDLIYTDTPIASAADDRSKTQYFWEAFPAGSGVSDRTTYLFTYMDCKPERPGIMEIMESYFERLPRYQGKSIDDLDVLRVLYGAFPTYRSSPLATPFDRILQVGDASGIQSPLSFGGFGSLTRHLERLVGAIDECLSSPDEAGLLDAHCLSAMNPYQPSLSAGWMFQRAMSVPVGANPPSNLIQGTLANTFRAMGRLGDDTMKPFLQDVLQFGPLLRTLVVAGSQDLLTPLKIVPHVGPMAFLDFLWHFFNLGLYTLLYRTLGAHRLHAAESMSPREAFLTRRKVEQWRFGAGLDYDDHT